MKLILMLACIALIGCDLAKPIKETAWTEDYKVVTLLQMNSTAFGRAFLFTMPDGHDYITWDKGGICHAAGCAKCDARMEATK